MPTEDDPYIASLKNEIEELREKINHSGAVKRKVNREVLLALQETSPTNPDEHHIPPVTLAWRAVRAEAEIENLRTTNARLNRRCQRAESQAAKWRRRYAAVTLPLAAAHEVATRLVEKLQRCLNEQSHWIETPWRRCWWCRIRRTLRRRNRQ